MSLNTQHIIIFLLQMMTHAQTCCIFSPVLDAWYLCVPGSTPANVCCQLKLCAARQMGWVGWVLGVCIIDRACTLCNHNRQVFPKIPRSARERLLFWCLPALGRSMDRTILWCSWSNVALSSLVCTKLFRSTCCFDTAKILFAAQSIFNHMQQRICGVKYLKHHVTLRSKVKIYTCIPLGKVMKWDV